MGRRALGSGGGTADRWRRVRYLTGQILSVDGGVVLGR
jgi:hypothetical protein